MSTYLPAALGIAVMLIGSTALAKERSEVEKSSVKAATDCVAAAALNNPNITKLYQEHRLSEVTNWIVLKSDACNNPLTAMRLLHDRFYGEGTGQAFVRGAYLADLPRAVRERIRVELAKRREPGDVLEGWAEGSTDGKRFVNHNGSVMLMEIGDAQEDASQIKIYYRVPSDIMRSLVAPGTLFFDGSVALEAGLVAGTARVYKFGCRPLEYDVTGVFKDRLELGILELQGPAPSFGRGCSLNEFAFDHNSRLTFEPLFARQDVIQPRR